MGILWSDRAEPSNLIAARIRLSVLPEKSVHGYSGIQMGEPAGDGEALPVTLPKRRALIRT